MKKSPNSKEKTSKKLSYKENEILQKHPEKIEQLENEILQKHPEKIEQLENEIKELQNALSNPKIYEEFGIQNLYEKLEKSQKSLEKLEDEYFAVLEKSEREA